MLRSGVAVGLGRGENERERGIELGFFKKKKKLK